jgi:hypothetical protein
VALTMFIAVRLATIEPAKINVNAAMVGTAWGKNFSIGV